MPDTLLPCPSGHDRAEIYEYSQGLIYGAGGWWSVHCNGFSGNSPCTWKVDDFRTRRGAIHAWNRREPK